MSNNQNYGRGINGKGYYIALILSAVAIGITGILYYRNTQEVQQVSQAPEQQATVAVDLPQQDQVVVSVDPVVVEEPAEDVAATVAASEVLKTAAPVSGETVAEYAMDCLSYNQTTRDWRVHNGVDIAAEAGTAVLAAADGVVYTAYTDDIMGTTVVIRHEGGYTTQYASLAEDLQISVGEQVTMGQPIGTVGETALVETAMGPHLHFSVLYNDASMDPAEFLSLGGE